MIATKDVKVAILYNEKVYRFVPNEGAYGCRKCALSHSCGGMSETERNNRGSFSKICWQLKKSVAPNGYVRWVCEGEEGDDQYSSS